MEVEDGFAPVLNEGHVPGGLFKRGHAAPARDVAGNSRHLRSSGHASQSAPWLPAPISAPRTEPSCLTNGVIPALWQSRTSESAHSISIGRAPGPDSPPMISQ